MSHLSRLDERYGYADDCTYVSASNATVILSRQNGRSGEYVDLMSAFGAVNFGHQNPDIIAAIRSRPCDTVGICYPQEAEAVSEWMCTRLDRSQDTSVLFQVGGSHAVTTAIAMAQRARRGRIVAIRGGFHGLGLDSLAISSAQVSFALQCTGLLDSVTPRVSVIEHGQVPESWDDVSCIIYEPIQGANGYIPLDHDWLHQLEAAARRAGVVTIADEVQAGFHRHGPLSPARAIGLEPDIQLYSKSLTNGMFPLSALVYDRALDPPAEQPFLAHTFQTSVFGFYAARAVTEYVDTAPLAEMAASLNTRFLQLAATLTSEELAEEVHVTGPCLSFRPQRSSAREVVVDSLDHGLIVISGGERFERIRVAPPLTISPSDLDRALTILLSILRRT